VNSSVVDGTTDYVFCIRQLMEKQWQYNGYLQISEEPITRLGEKNYSTF